MKALKRLVGIGYWTGLVAGAMAMLMMMTHPSMSVILQPEWILRNSSESNTMKQIILVLLVAVGVFADQRRTISCEYKYKGRSEKISNKVNYKVNQDGFIVWVKNGYVPIVDSLDIDKESQTKPIDNKILIHRPDEYQNKYTIFGIDLDNPVEIDKIGEPISIKFKEGTLSCTISNGWD